MGHLFLLEVDFRLNSDRMYREEKKLIFEALVSFAYSLENLPKNRDNFKNVDPI